MTTKLSKTYEAVLKVIRKNPDITSYELKPLLPELTPSQVYNAVHFLNRTGAIRISGRKSFPNTHGRLYTHATYMAKHTRRPSAAAEVPKGVSIVTETVIPRVDAKLQAAYERLAMLHTETMAELAEEKKKREVHLCDSWWCRLKRAFV